MVLAGFVIVVPDLCHGFMVRSSTPAQKLRKTHAFPRSYIVYKIMVCCCWFFRRSWPGPVFSVLLGFYSGLELLTMKAIAKTQTNHECPIFLDNLKTMVLLVFLGFPKFS